MPYLLGLVRDQENLYSLYSRLGCPRITALLTSSFVGRLLTSLPSVRLNALFVGTSTGSGKPILSIFTCHWPSLNGPVVTGEPEPPMQSSAQIGTDGCWLGGNSPSDAQSQYGRP